MQLRQENCPVYKSNCKCYSFSNAPQFVTVHDGSTLFISLST